MNRTAFASGNYSRPIFKHMSDYEGQWFKVHFPNSGYDAVGRLERQGNKWGLRIDGILRSLRNECGCRSREDFEKYWKPIGEHIEQS